MDSVAVVTGSAQGVGLGITTVLLRQGWTVVGADQRPAAAALAGHERYRHVVGDLRDGGTCEHLIEAATQDLGRLDALVNNVGVGGARPFAETSDDDFDRYYDLNVRPMLRLSRLALPALATTGGNIVNIASAFGIVGVAVSAAYVPTKAAVVGITRMLATEFGRDGIRVNAVAPGLIRTPPTEERIAANAWWQRSMIEDCPLGRPGEAEEIGEAVAFLASPAASFITGVVLPVDGGWTMSKFLPEPAAQ